MPPHQFLLMRRLHRHWRPGGKKNYLFT